LDSVTTFTTLFYPGPVGAKINEASLALPLESLRLLPTLTQTSNGSEREVWLMSLLSTHEVKWRDRQPFLESKGYMLRPRLRPGWTPSWISAGKHHKGFEDSARLPLPRHPVSEDDHPVNVNALISFVQLRPLLVDATRISDDRLVRIKEVKADNLELHIALTLSEIDDPANHSVPIFDTFVDSDSESISYLVMPFLRRFNDPAFGVVAEVVDFADQVLEVRCWSLFTKARIS
jgi:hypothetical protein